MQVNPTTGQVAAGIGSRYNGIVLPGNGFPDSAKGHVRFASNPAAASLFHGLPDTISTADQNMFQPRFGLSWDVTGHGTTSLAGVLSREPFGMPAQLSRCAETVREFPRPTPSSSAIRRAGREIGRAHV